MLFSMDNALTAALLAAAATGVIWGLRREWQRRAGEWRRQQALKRMHQRINQREQDNKPSYRAVSIVPARPACKLARRYQNHRYLAGEAPRLPLAGCRASTCNCHYRHHTDRRSEDRRNLFGIDHVPIGIDKNRRGNDRRRSSEMAHQQISIG